MVSGGVQVNFPQNPPPQNAEQQSKLHLSAFS